LDSIVATIKNELFMWFTINKRKVSDKIFIDYGYIECKDYPMKFYLTNKGTKEIQEVVL
jgi:hypothetical protein